MASSTAERTTSVHTHTHIQPHERGHEEVHRSHSGPHTEHQHSSVPVLHAPDHTNVTPSRPHLHGTQSQMDTQYVNMLLALDDIPRLHNMYAGFFTWILLAGFILFPGTFTSLQNLSASGQVESRLVNAVTHIPLFVIAWLCCGIGGTGMMWLWWRWRKNYLWALNRIFLPGVLNSLAGLISTIVNIFGVQHGELSTTSKVTIVVTTVSTGVFGLLTLIYSLWLVRRVKARHDRDVGKERAGKYGEGVVDLSKRKIREKEAQV
ncbi:hypothetical protein B0H34DRAFT_717552 [Crassisporium funariophilum]|nr:hypothetical protein B0H34DRAFT_717552 [Crassisporium funariophilum]